MSSVAHQAGAEAVEHGLNRQQFDGHAVFARIKRLLLRLHGVSREDASELAHKDAERLPAR